METEVTPVAWLLLGLAYSSVFGFERSRPTKREKILIELFTGEKVSLTQRELDCLRCLQEGKSAKVSGAELFLSSRTVESHLQTLKKKLGCRTKYEILGKVSQRV